LSKFPFKEQGKDLSQWRLITAILLHEKEYNIQVVKAPEEKSKKKKASRWLHDHASSNANPEFLTAESRATLLSKLNRQASGGRFVSRPQK
jgi:hypothetical protein